MQYEPSPLPYQLLNFLDPYYHKDYFQGERPITNKKADVSPWCYRYADKYPGYRMLI